MSGDKVKAAARERTAETGERYAAARREVIRAHQAASNCGPPPGSKVPARINGPCGAGKKTTAAELSRRLPGSVACAPGAAGMAMHRMLPPAVRRRWQDIPAWRHPVPELLRLTLAGQDGPVILPGTLADDGHFREITGGLRDDAVPVHHFALLAGPATVVRRLRAPNLGLEPRTQPQETEVLDGWLAQLRRPESAQHVRADHKTVVQVAGIIARSAGPAVMPSADGPVRTWPHRDATTARHIRQPQARPDAAPRRARSPARSGPDPGKPQTVPS